MNPEKTMRSPLCTGREARFLIAIPIYNEQRYIPRVLAHVLEYADDVLVIDDARRTTPRRCFPSFRWR